MHIMFSRLSDISNKNKNQSDFDSMLKSTGDSIFENQLGGYDIGVNYSADSP